MNKRKRMKQRATSLLRRGQPVYFFLRCMADILQNVKTHLYKFKGLERI